MLLLLRRHGWGLALFCAWLVVVATGIAHHEFWRDEVRALSIAIDATSPLDLFHRMQDDGHPMLWHSLLAIGHWLTGSTLVLPTLSFLLCAGAVALICFASPLPRWQQALFVLGGLTLYEYAVMARNYGISMLLMFAFAWLYPARRQHPLRLGLVVALLANTNVHSLALAGLLMALWLWDDLVREPVGWRSRAARRLYGAALIAALGAAFSMATFWPSEQMLASDTSQYGGAKIADGIAALILRPNEQFDDLLLPVAGSALLSGAVLVGALGALLPHWRLVGVAGAGLLALSILFSLVYGGSYRHEGLWLAFLVTLAWIARETPPDAAPRATSWLHHWQRVGAYIALPVLLAFQIVSGKLLLERDLSAQLSANAAFGRFLDKHPEYEDAILVGEPDYYLEAIRAYADNDVYVVRERAMGHVVHFVRTAQGDLTLRELLQVAWELRERTGRRVLLALGHLDKLEPPAMAPSEGVIRYGYGHRTFSWTRADLWTFRACTRQVQRFAKMAGDERYVVYEVVAPPGP